MARAEAKGLDVIDGTCTWVIAEQRELGKLVEEGYDRPPGHAQAPRGRRPARFRAGRHRRRRRGGVGVDHPAPKADGPHQPSTQPPWKFEKLAAFMTSRAHELKVVNTVCPVTMRRQEDTVEAASAVDLMVVVGGRSGANTKELTRLCGIVGTPAVQIESAADLDDQAVFDGAHVVGVTGGTSTPIEDLRDVAERILQLAGTEGPRLPRPRTGAGARGPRGRRLACPPHDLARHGIEARCRRRGIGVPARWFAMPVSQSSPSSAESSGRWPWEPAASALGGS